MEATKVKTFGLRLSELRPCDACGGRVAPIFWHIQVRHAVVNARNANAVLGVSQLFGHRSLALAEVMAPGADEAVEVLDEPGAVGALFLCQDCFAGRTAGQPLNLAVILERVNDLAERAAARREKEATDEHQG